MRSNIHTYIDDEVVSLLMHTEALRTQIDFYKKNSQKIHTLYRKYNATWKFAYIQDDQIEISEGRMRNAFLHLMQKTNAQEEVGIDDLLIAHEKIFYEISPTAGFFRKNRENRIRKKFKYKPPDIESIRPLLAKTIIHADSVSKQAPILKSIIAWYAFEQVSPFSVGNTILAQILHQLICIKFNYSILPMSQILTQSKSEYFQIVFGGDEDVKSFIKFILGNYINAQEQFITQSKKLTGRLHAKKLPLRRFEILQIIKDHQLVSFDFIQRRFMGVSGRLLRYDLKKLQDAHLIQKRGVTRGVTYQIAGE